MKVWDVATGRKPSRWMGLTNVRAWRSAPTAGSSRLRTG